MILVKEGEEEVNKSMSAYVCMCVFVLMVLQKKDISNQAGRARPLFDREL